MIPKSLPSDLIRGWPPVRRHDFSGILFRGICMPAPARADWRPLTWGLIRRHGAEAITDGSDDRR
jgi:hypothetical protein